MVMYITYIFLFKYFSDILNTVRIAIYKYFIYFLHLFVQINDDRINNNDIALVLGVNI